MKQKAKVIFCIEDNDSFKILLGRRTSGGETFWWLPGGSIEKDEDAFTAVLRELEEEILPGPVLQQSLSFYISEKSQIPFVFETPNARYTTFVLKVPLECISEPVAIKEEFDEMKWYDIQDLPPNMSREYAYLEPVLESKIKAV